MNSRAFFQLLLLGALWGAAFMFMRVAAPEFGVFPLAAARVGLALLIMLGLVLLLRERLGMRRRWRAYLLVGAVNTALPFIAYSFAAQHIPAGYSAIANSTTPVWSALIAWLWFKERLGALRWLGIAFAFTGVLVLVGLQPVALTPLVLGGMIAATLAASLYATAGFLIRRYLTDDTEADSDHNTAAARPIGQIASATGMVWGATVWLLLPGVLMAPTTLPSAPAWGAVLGLSVFCTAAGYALFFHLIKSIGPQRASSVAFLFPLFAAFWGWLVLGEPITANMLAGMTCVLAGTALVSTGAATRAQVAAPRAPGGWDRLRDHLLLPFAFGLSPMPLRRALVRWIRRSPQVFQLETAALRAALPAYLPDADVDEAAADLRFTRVADYADVWVSLTRSDAWMRRHLQLTAPAALSTPALFVTFHYGGGWWLTRALRSRGQPISIVMQRGGRATGWVARVVSAFGLWRMRQIERVCRSPLIYTDHGGAARQVLKTWKRGASVLALLDLPPPLVDRTAAVQFFGQTAWFPPTLPELAARQQRPVYLFIGQWNRITLQPELRITALDGTDATATLQAAVRVLEQTVRGRPGGWHAWGDVGLYFVKR